MRNLFVSNFYPPLELGGWGQLARDLVQGMRTRGHTVGVLTSRHRADEVPERETDTYRVLQLEADLYYYRPIDFALRHRRHKRENLEQVNSVFQEFEPDIIFIHNMWLLSPLIPWSCEQLLPGRVVYYYAGDWLSTPDIHTTYWQEPTRRVWLRFPKKLFYTFGIKPLLCREYQRYKLKLDHVLCVSNAVRRELARHANVPLSHSQVVYNGIDLKQFPWSEPQLRRKGDRISLLYAGGIAPHKGVHTAIEATGILVHRMGVRDVYLTLVGDGHPAYVDRLKRLAGELDVSSHITFFGRVSRIQMPQLLQHFDVLVFPSTGPEALPRVVQEAMACGLVVIGTATGGTPEILEHDVNGLAFRSGDAVDLAAQLERIADDPQLPYRLAVAGRQTVEERFNFDHMVDQIEGIFVQLLLDRTRMATYAK